MVNVEDPQPLFGLVKLSSENPPVLMLAPFLGWEVLYEALKEASCTVGNNIIHSLHHKLLLCFFFNFRIFIARKGSHQKYIISFLTDEDGGK